MNSGDDDDELIAGIDGLVDQPAIVGGLARLDAADD
jgi:hypothetical protein